MLLILQGVTGLMGGDAHRSQARRLVDIAAEPQHLMSWIVMVAQRAARAFDSHCLQTIDVENAASRLGAASPSIFSRPPFACGTPTDSGTIIEFTCPPMTA